MKKKYRFKKIYKCICIIVCLAMVSYAAVPVWANELGNNNGMPEQNGESLESVDEDETQSQEESVDDTQAETFTQSEDMSGQSEESQESNTGDETWNQDETESESESETETDIEMADMRTLDNVTLGGNGTDAQYADLWALFADEKVAGDVTVCLLSDVRTTANESTGSVVVPERISSLTFTADQPQCLEINNTHSILKYTSLFANGKNVTIGPNITFGKYSGSIFGGNCETAAAGNPVITVDGNVVSDVYGGGYNSELNGGPSIIINGQVNGVYGGGSANDRDSDIVGGFPTYFKANVTGNTTINIAEGGAVKNVRGGGHAESVHSSSSGIVECYLQADVNGSVNIQIDGAAKEVVGGGYAGGIIEDYSGYDATADVGGDVSVCFGAKSGSADNFSVELYAGGYAITRGLADNLRYAQANVGGSISMTAFEDDTAASSQKNNKAFSRCFGGGYALGPGAVANVSGNTSIDTARPCWESTMGIVGGGWAIYGGTANVAGEAAITVRGIAGQKSGYENANAVIGGGYAGGGSSADITTVSTANTGSTKIIISDEAQLTSGGDNSISIVGGGYAEGSSVVTGSADYDKLPVQANVLGDTHIVVGEGCYVYGRIQGGGLVRNRGEARVSGNTYIEIAGNCAIGNSVVGGGYAGYGASSVAGAEVDADVEGTAHIKAGSSTLKGIYGGGWAYSADAHADTGGVDFELDDTTLTTWIYGGGWANAAGSETVKTSADILGDVAMNINNVSAGTVGVVYAGGRAVSGETAKADVKGKSTINWTGGTPYWIYASGYQNSMVKDSEIRLIDTDGATVRPWRTEGTAATVNDAVLSIAGDVSMISVNSFKKVNIEKNAVFSVTGNNWPLNGAGDLDIAEDAELKLTDVTLASGTWNGPILTGNMTGNGKLTMPVGKHFYIYGSVEGSHPLAIEGTPVVGEVYITSEKGGEGDFIYSTEGLKLIKTKGSDLSNLWEMAAACTVKASVQGEHGSITPEGDVTVVHGSSQLFDFVPEDGYKVEKVIIDGVESGSPKNYTFTDITQDHTIQVSFTELTALDAQEAIDTITPSEVDPDKHSDEVLDAKIVYEQLAPEEKKKVGEGYLEELNKEISKSNLIEIKYKQISGAPVNGTVDNLYDLASSITLEEAKELKEGNIQKIQLVLHIAPQENADELIRQEETEFNLGVQFDISVTEQIDSQEAQKVSELPRPIKIVLDIPENLFPDKDVERTFVVLHKHNGNINIFNDMDDVDDTITIQNNIYSTYAISYKDKITQTYTVSFNSMGGSDIGALTKIIPGSRIAKPAAPQKENFTFAGWYTDDKCTQIWDFDTDVVNQNMTLYAKWDGVPVIPDTEESESGETDVKETDTKESDIEETDSKETEPKETETKESDSVDTGDTGLPSGIYMALAISALTLLTFAVIYLRRNKYRNRHR